MPIEYYEVRVLVRHPSLSEAALKSFFGEEPAYSGDVGDRGKRYSFWSKIDRVTGQRAFSLGIGSALDWLERKGEGVAQVLASAGMVEVILQLPGDRNIGDSLDAKELVRAGALGVSLGIEVFPAMNSAPK